MTYTYYESYRMMLRHTAAYDRENAPICDNFKRTHARSKESYGVHLRPAKSLQTYGWGCKCKRSRPHGANTCGLQKIQVQDLTPVSPWCEGDMVPGPLTLSELIAEYPVVYNIHCRHDWRNKQHYPWEPWFPTNRKMAAKPLEEWMLAPRCANLSNWQLTLQELTS